MPSPIVDLLADLDAALRPLQVRWYLFGAQASILYGAARLTADVDVTLDPGDLDTPRLVTSLQGRRFTLRVGATPEFVARNRVLPMVHDPTRMPVDLVLAGPGIETLFFERARTLRIEGLEVPVAAADDIVAMKILAGRPKDLDDALAVLRSQGAALDLARSRATLRLLEQALDRADLLPVLDELTRRARSSR